MKLNYTYYPAGQVETIASSNAHGVSAAYTYDDVGRLQTVVDNRLAANNTTTYSYDAASNVHQAVYPNSPNNAPSTYTYDTLNRLTALSTPVSSYAYTLGPTGNRTKAVEGNGRTLAWSYDGIYRLTNEAVSADPDNVNGSVGYVLDPVGNRKSATSTLSGVNSSGTFTYNSDDELLPGEGDTYDNNGNTLSTGGKTFTYDSENHLLSMNGGAVTLTYDGDGNRVAKTAGSVTTLYLVDDVNPTGLPQVMEELVGGAVQREYTYGLDRISENQFVSGAWTASFYGADGMDSVRQLTNSAGTVTDTYEYDAFGNMVNKTGPAPSTYTPNNYLYRGEQYDSDLGLYYLRARYYNPVTGRFLNVDPLAGDGQRRYEYAGTDPVNGSDPSGDFVLESYWPICCGKAPTFPPLKTPPWCAGAGSSLVGSFLPPCPTHWIVKVDYRPILRWKKDATHPNFLLGHWRHTYIEIDPPPPAKPETWGVLGVGAKGDNQEVVKNQTADDRDPLDGGPIGVGIPVPSSDEQAEHLESALDATVYPPFICPSCGPPYHNSALNGGFKPSLHDPFTFFNSNTYTFNMINNCNLAPPPISNAPGYKPSSAYSGCP